MPIIKSYARRLLTVMGEAGCDLIWVPDTPDEMSEYQCWIEETGEVWWFPQSLVRALRSMSTPLRQTPTDIKLSAALLDRYRHHILRHRKSPFWEQANVSTR